MEEILERVAKARALRKDDELDESQDILLALLEDYPSDPLVLFEVGGSYDVMGEEELAVPYYRRALAEGLEEPDRQECLICLGSSLRVIGRNPERGSRSVPRSSQHQGVSGTSPIGR